MSLLVAIALLLAPAAAYDLRAPDLFTAELSVPAGTVVLQLNRTWAPLGVDRFYNLLVSGFFSAAPIYHVDATRVRFGLSVAGEETAKWEEVPLGDDAPEASVSNVAGTLAFESAGPFDRSTALSLLLADNAASDGTRVPIGQALSGLELLSGLPAVTSNSYQLQLYGIAAFGGVNRTASITSGRLVSASPPPATGCADNCGGHGRCETDGSCSCLFGWSAASNCQLCDAARGFGGDRCARRCPLGRFGETCAVCPGTSSDDFTAVCNGHGRCLPDRTATGCECFNAWTGAACDVCPTGWAGADCDSCAAGADGDACRAALDASPPLPSPTSYTLRLNTTAGDVRLSVTRSWSPQGADRLMELARGGALDGAAVIAALPGHSIRFAPAAAPALSQKFHSRLLRDDGDQLRPVTRGTVMLAGAGPHTRSMHVVIALGRLADWDGSAIPIGTVSAGLAQLDSMTAASTVPPTAKELLYLGASALAADSDGSVLFDATVQTFAPAAAAACPNGADGVCNGHGWCDVGTGNCRCMLGFSAESECFFCADGFSGAFCSDRCAGGAYGTDCRVCPADNDLFACATNGVCDDGQDGSGRCRCDEDTGWMGNNCATCSEGWTGARCDVPPEEPAAGNKGDGNGDAAAGGSTADWLSIVLVILAVLLMIVAIVMLVRWHRRRKRTKAREKQVEERLEELGPLGKLPDGWSRVRDADGKVFYTNKLTGETSYEVPKEGDDGARQVDDLPPGWTTKLSATGRTFYLHEETGQRSWSKPQVEKEEDEDNSALIDLPLATGGFARSTRGSSVASMSIAKSAASKWRGSTAAGKSDKPRAKSVMDDIASRVALARSTRAASAAGASALKPMPAASPSSSADAALELPDGWTAHKTDEGKTYYFHEASGKTRWDHPSGVSDLPAGWSEHTNEAGKTFYYHADSGETRWDKPTEE
eukprot:PLAT4402.3.p1 GENE.PLAT4402.3~~PLAT4402.3.p1  ORF type:complete len:939 (+),score=346.52 PLAT4402.3:1678-4494(+)